MISVHPGERFRRLMEGDRVVELVQVHDALTAMQAEDAGFEAVMVGGGATAHFGYGLPDTGLLSLPEIIDNVRKIAGAVEIPVIADLDDGGISPMQARRHIRMAEQVGAAGVMIEDTFEKHLWSDAAQSYDVSTDRLHSVSRMVDVIKAAAEGKRDERTVIMGRTLAFPANGLDDAVERARKFAEAGSDLVHISRIPYGLLTRELVQSIPAPMVCLPIDTATAADRAALVEAGIKVVAFFAEPMLASYRAFQTALEDIKSGKPAEAHYIETMRPLLNTLNLKQWSELATRVADD